VTNQHSELELYLMVWQWFDRPVKFIITVMWA